MFNDVNGQKVLAGVWGGLIIPVFQFFYGTNSTVLPLMAALVFFIAMDWMSGSRASKKDKSYGSKYGIDGIFRTFFMVLLPAGGHLLDTALQLPGILFGIFVFGLLYHTLQSMTANVIRAGWADWLPISILEMVTNWVKSEIDSKVSRAQQRKSEREEKGQSLNN